MTTMFALSAVVCLLILRVAGSRLNLSHTAALYIIVLLAVFLLPVGSLTMAGYGRGVFSDISSLSTALLIWAVFGRYWTGPHTLYRNTLDLQPLLIPLALASFIFYPMTLGLSIWDPYSIGYQPLMFTLVMALFGIGLVYIRKYLAAFLLAIVLVSFLAHLQESDNLWDYLLDPLLAIFLWVWLLARLATKIRACQRSVAG